MAKVIGFEERAKRQITHSRCAAIVEYVLTEVQSYIQTDYTGGTERVEYIVCPNCGEKIEIGY